MNREIVKLQNYFENLNLRNAVNLKNAMKNIENIKLKEWKFSPKVVNDTINLNINEDHCEHLGLHTQGNLKTIYKPLGRSSHENNKTMKQKGKRFKNNIKLVKNCDIKDVSKQEQINMKGLEEITFTGNYYQSNNLDVNSNIKVQCVQESPEEDCCDLNKPKNDSNEFRSDLQSLLIMMAINSKAINNKEDNNCVLESIQAIPSRKGISNEVKSQFKETFEKEDTKRSELLCIIPLRTEEQSRNNFLSKKVITKWISYAQEKRRVREREVVLNNFFEKLAEKKSSTNQTPDCIKKTKSHIKDYNTYQHRYKVQQNIIALQKMKLEEQTKIIEQLKYNKIIESTKESLETLRENVSKTYYQIDPHLKPKIKCLTNELKIRALDEPALVLHCLKVPQFIQRMEKRAREREEKHALIRERRRQMEEERIRVKQQSELAKLEMDKEEKTKRMKELREKRKREKIENIRKKQHYERMRALAVMAELHYERNLMTKYGINPLKRLVQIKRDNIEKAKSHYLFQLKKNVFLHWMWHTEDMWYERNYKADVLYRKKILGRAFNSFKQNYHEYKLKMQVAEDYYDLFLTQLVFRKFGEGIQIIRKENKIKWNKAVLYHNGCVLFKAFTCWRTLPALNALKREQEMRKLRWRKKVLQVVPDYNPPDE